MYGLLKWEISQNSSFVANFPNSKGPSPSPKVLKKNTAYVLSSLIEPLIIVELMPLEFSEYMYISKDIVCYRKSFIVIAFRNLRRYRV